jgi:glycosyltransferase involved in cell wall biosynthesis
LHAIPLSRAQYVALLNKSGQARFVLPFSWRFILPIAKILSLVPVLNAHLPGFFRPLELRARMLPVAFKKPKQLNIAYLTGEYPRATDTFIQREVAGLRDQGLNVLTCSIRKTGVEHLVGPEQYQEARTTFYILDAARAPFRMLGAHFRAFWRSPRKFASAVKLANQTSAPGFRARLYQMFYFVEAVVLADHMQHNGVTHLHNHIAKASCTVAMLASRISGIPYSFTLHGPDIFFEPMRWRLDAKIANASFVACISNYCRSQAMIFSEADHWSKLHIVHCGVNPARYRQDPQGKRRISKNLLFVGRLAAIKGLPVLFSIIPDLYLKHPDLKLTLVGDGPDRVSLTKQARELGLESCIEFAGYRSQSDVAELLNDTDILILPSFAEGVPVVLMEAMAAEVPVITSQIAGIPELVDHGVSGLLIPPGDENALAQSIDRLLADGALRRKMGKAGRCKVMAEFDIAKETVWLADILRQYSDGRPIDKTRPTGNTHLRNVEAGE